MARRLWGRVQRLAFGLIDQHGWDTVNLAGDCGCGTAPELVSQSI